MCPAGNKLYKKAKKIIPGEINYQKDLKCFYLSTLYRIIKYKVLKFG